MYTESSFEQLDALTPEPFAQVAAPLKNPLPELPASLRVVSDYFEINYDTLRNKWIGKVEACYEGLDCPPIRDKSKRVTAFGFEAIREFLECKTDKDYQFKLRSRYGDTPQAEQPVTSPQITGGLMNLPSLSPVTSIVPQGQTLSTDNNPAKDLAIRSDALSEGLVEIENLKNFLKGASAVADSYIENLEKTTEEEERQAKEIEELAFELEVKADYIKRAEVRKGVINKESSKTRATAESKVADFASFFAKRSSQNASS
jgi:hypothetical protein